MRYAVVRNNTVDNVIECNGFTVQSLAKVMNCMLIACENYAVTMGDTYDAGIFYRDGKALERILTDSEKIAVLESENAMLKERLTSMENATLGMMSKMTEV